MTLEGSSRKKEAICPQSTIESVDMGNYVRKLVPNQTNGDVNKLARESTIESSNRRDFIRKAALFGAAATVGSAFLGSKIVPESSARSCVRLNVSPPRSIRPNTIGNCCPTGDALFGGTCSGIGVLGDARTTGIGVEGLGTKSAGVFGQSCCSVGVYGHSPKSIGVFGNSTCFYGVEGCSTKSIGVYGKSSCSYGVEGYSPHNLGVLGESCCSIGVYGYSIRSIGVFGNSYCSYAVKGVSCKSVGVYGESTKSIGVSGNSTCTYGVQGISSKSVGVWGQSSCASGVKGYSPKSTGVVGASCCSYGVWGCSAKSVGVYGQSSCSYAVEGYSPKNVGVLGESCCSVGVYGYSPKSVGVFGDSSCSYAVKGVSLKSVGVSGSSSGAGGIGVEGVAANSGAIPIVARGESCQSANLQQWRNSCCTPLSVVNKCGWLGLGALTAPTTLTVGGSVSAKTVMVTQDYSMGALDFAVLAKGKIKVTLPPAGTAIGMIVFVKNISKSKVTIEAFATSIETDKIEGASSKDLKKQYDSLQLISNGTDEWLVLGNSICGAFTS